MNYDGDLLKIRATKNIGTVSYMLFSVDKFDSWVRSL